MRYYVLIAFVIGLAEGNVWAKPVTPDYSRLSSAHPAWPPARTLEPVAPTPPAPAQEPVVPSSPTISGQGAVMSICQPDVVVGDKVSKGGCVDAEIQYEDLNPPPKNAKDLFVPNRTLGEINPSQPNVITIDKNIKGTSEELNVLTHEARHLLNLKNRFCEKYGYDYNSQECGLIDELSAFLSEGWSYEKAFNHIRDKYPEYRGAIDKIEATNTELGQICLPPTHDTVQSHSPTNSLDTSELEELLKEQLVFLESLLAKGKRAADSEIDVYNARQKKLAHVTMDIARKINSLSVPDEEKQRIAEEKLAKATALAMQVQKLVDQVVAKKLIGGLKPLALTDLNGAAPAQATEDNGGCKCKNPSPHYVKVSDDIPAAVRCTRCGKIVGVAHHGKIIRASRP